MADVPIWDARAPQALAFFAGEVLGPLVLATRPHDIKTPQALAEAAAAWILCLSDVPADVLRRGVATVLGAGPKWMPRPGDLREACAADIAKLRKLAGDRGAAIIAACQVCHGSTWAENADGRVSRCDCHAHAIRCLAGIPEALALPPAVFEEGAV